MSDHNADVLEVAQPPRRDKPTPLDYSTLFEQMPGGQQILSELVAMFGHAAYVPGGHEADREQCYRAGQRRVVDYILDQINRANGA